MQTELQQRMDGYGAGVKVLEVKLEDVHPALEVVDTSVKCLMPLRKRTG